MASGAVTLGEPKNEVIIGGIKWFFDETVDFESSITDEVACDVRLCTVLVDVGARAKLGRVLPR